MNTNDLPSGPMTADEIVVRLSHIARTAPSVSLQLRALFMLMRHLGLLTPAKTAKPAPIPGVAAKTPASSPAPAPRAPAPVAKTPTPAPQRPPSPPAANPQAPAQRTPTALPPTLLALARGEQVPADQLAGLMAWCADPLG